MRKILDRSDLSDDQKLELLQGGMTEEQRRKVEELLKSGLSVEQVNMDAVSESDPRDLLRRQFNPRP